MNTAALKLGRFFALTIAGVLTTVVLIGCQDPQGKVDTAREKIADGKQDLKEAKREVRAEWQEDWLKFKSDNDKDIADNERRIIILRKEVKDIDVRNREKYTVSIDALEKRNNGSRDRINQCKDEGDAQWGEFKKDIKRDMDDISTSLKNITIKNS
jgi:hypothetical protein